jgi:mRNA-degrading endonuclease toxin of MazEF toxin-antitoxin module
MVDKIVSVPRASIVREVGRCDEGASHTVDDALRNWLGL